MSDDPDWTLIVQMSEEILELKLELERADARLTVMRGEAWLRANPAPSVFEDKLEEAPFG